MVQGQESKEGEEGIIAAGPSFCLNIMVNSSAVVKPPLVSIPRLSFSMDFCNFFRSKA